MKSVVITGASTGIGWGAAAVLIKKGFRVFGSVRQASDADRLGAEFGPNFIPLMFDVTDEEAVSRAAAKARVEMAGQTLFGLVNNAGVAVSGPLLHLPLADFRYQMDVNLTGVVIVTQAFAPLLGAEAGLMGAPGRIIMISSVGGKNASPFMAPYCASKFALEGLSESLRRELLLVGVDVIIVAPGAVATPIWSKADVVDVSAYHNTVFAPALDKVRAYMVGLGPKGLKPEVLGEAIFKALTVAKPKARYTVAPDPLQNFITNALPRRTVDRIMADRLGLSPKGAPSV